MSKQLFIRFEKSAPWETLVEMADEKIRRETGNEVFAGIQIRTYDLADQQFAAITLDVKKGKELSILIPRDIIVTIIEGKGGLEKLGFGLTGQSNASQGK